MKSSLNSLTLDLSSDTIPNTRIRTLLDSGSTHCFLDTSFISNHKLQTSNIGPIPLRLFNGSSNSEIRHSVDLLIRFPTGEQHSVMFFVTPLDASCNTVLGHNWLTRYNLLIDWVLSSITFQTLKPADVLANPETLALAPISSDPPTPLIALHIALVNAAAFVRISKLDDTQTFQLFVSPRDKTISDPTPVDMGSIPKEYHEFSDVFNKTRADTLGPHKPYDLKSPVFTNQQLSKSLQAMSLCFPVLRAAITLDIDLLHSDIRCALSSDPTISEHLSNPSGRWSMDPDGYLQLNSWIYVPDVNNLRLRVLQYRHDHPISGHFGQNRTMDLVRRDYVWPKLHNSIKLYIKSCTTCVRSKSQRHRPYGLLKQLPIPERPWNSISMDFIEKLPRSSGFDTILIIVDHFTKQSLFIPTVDTITAPMLAKLFMLHVFSKHGETRSSVTCHLQLRYRVHVLILPLTTHSS